MTDPRTLNEITKMNPPFELLLQAAYVVGDKYQRAILERTFPEIIKEIPNER